LRDSRRGNRGADCAPHNCRRRYNGSSRNIVGQAVKPYPVWPTRAGRVTADECSDPLRLSADDRFLVTKLK
jgi:hypothetical protein